ncbi:ASCH domain-containing protein [Paenibacillus sp. IHBB 10380]|uniref:ASCH domain-containing protein n=1 Tax=Paenibacillus sp. IHBB 10380 TaxID=1566358 RepID=UPI0005CFC974|nr:ASCH domain-containing protein [Paenibacillus sp. IHBB 10380]AJS59222.1 2-oxoglutarate dehydrogenase E1 [Paenibacillus sp. IHBB 10380]
MKVITIIQPWATLIALGEKKFETRSWETKHRGELAIHAGKKVDKDAWMNEVIYMTLQKHGILTVNDLPTGVIVAIANLEDCYKISRPSGEDGIVCLKGNPTSKTWGGYPSNERIFGDYSEGRYAWELADVKPLTDQISAKGQQGLWNWEGE